MKSSIAASLTILLVMVPAAVAADSGGGCAPPCDRCRKIRVDFKDAPLTDLLEILAIAGGYRLDVDPCLEGKNVESLKLENVTIDEILERFRKDQGLVCRRTDEGLLFSCSEEGLRHLTPRDPRDPRKKEEGH